MVNGQSTLRGEIIVKRGRANWRRIRSWKDADYEADRIFNSFRKHAGIEADDFESEDELRDFIRRKIEEDEAFKQMRNLGERGRELVIEEAIKWWHENRTIREELEERKPEIKPERIPIREMFKRERERIIEEVYPIERKEITPERRVRYIPKAEAQVSSPEEINRNADLVLKFLKRGVPKERIEQALREGKNINKVAGGILSGARRRARKLLREMFE
jgi:hypothetical protein